MLVTDLEPAYALHLYYQLYRIRQVELALAAAYPRGEMRCPTHFSIGQEAAAVGVCEALQCDDVLYSTHRCHAHYLAKGGNLQAMIDELRGLPSGCTAGVGGSMHLTDMSVKMMGTSAIVGSSIAFAVGAAWAIKLKGQQRVAVACVGDSGPETGVWWESLSFAALHRLPLVIAVENNFYSTQTHITVRQVNDHFWARGRALGIGGYCADGTSILKVLEGARMAKAEAREGKPVILQIQTYRFLEHVGPYDDTDLGYRSREELEAARSRDPVALYRAKLVKAGWLEDVLATEKRVDAEVLQSLK